MSMGVAETNFVVYIGYINKGKGTCLHLENVFHLNNKIRPITHDT